MKPSALIDCFGQPLYKHHHSNGMYEYGWGSLRDGALFVCGCNWRFHKPMYEIRVHCPATSHQPVSLMISDSEIEGWLEANHGWINEVLENSQRLSLCKTTDTLVSCGHTLEDDRLIYQEFES